MQDPCKTIWITFGDGRAARVRIDVHAPVLPTPLEVGSPAAPDEVDMEHVLHGLANDEGMDEPPFEIGLPPVKRGTAFVCGRCNGYGWVPSKSDCDTDPCPACSLPPVQ